MKEFYTIGEIATMLSITPRTVSSYIKNKKIKIVNIGRLVRITKEEVERIKKEGI